MNKLVVVFAFLLVGFTAKAQDKIYLTDNSIILGKVTEIGISEIKYKKQENLTGPDYVMPKSAVAMIFFENGTHEVIAPARIEPGEPVIVDILPYYKVGKNLLTMNYFDLIYKNLSVGYTRFLCDKFSLSATGSFGFTYRNNYTYPNGSSFLNFDKDYFHGLVSANFFPSGMNKISYFTGASFMAGVGGDYIYDYYNPYQLVQKSYYGFYVNNGIQFNITRYFNMRTSLSLGLVDRDMNGDFITHGLFEVSAGIRF